MTSRSRHICFQPEPFEIFAKWTIEGKSYRTRLQRSACTHPRGIKPPSSVRMHCLLKLSSPPVPGKVRRMSEREFIGVHEKPRIYGEKGGVEVVEGVEVDSTVYNFGDIHGLYSMYCKFPVNTWMNSQTSVINFSARSYSFGPTKIATQAPV